MYFLFKGNHDLNDPHSVEELLQLATNTARVLLDSEEHIKDFDHYTSATSFDRQAAIILIHPLLDSSTNICPILLVLTVQSQTR